MTTKELVPQENRDDGLERFVTAQASGYPIAIAEIRSGKKQSHWMWYIFPQIEGLGYSATSRHFAIKSLSEAKAFLSHPLLGERLMASCHALLGLKDISNAILVLGMPDAMKLKSSMTLFLEAQPNNEALIAVLKKFFNGDKDNRTLQILQEQRLPS